MFLALENWLASILGTLVCGILWLNEKIEYWEVEIEYIKTDPFSLIDSIIKPESEAHIAGCQNKRQVP